MLIDRESSHNFMKPSAVVHCEELFRPMEPFVVNIANGNSMKCNRWVPNPEWEIQGHLFSHGLYLLGIKPYDAILEVDWMRTYSPFTLDFQNLQLTFDKGREEVILQGD